LIIRLNYMRLSILSLQKVDEHIPVADLFPGLPIPDHTLLLVPLMGLSFPVTRASSKLEDPELRFGDSAETRIIY
jgi:hypothetical protein